MDTARSRRFSEAIGGLEPGAGEWVSPEDVVGGGAAVALMFAGFFAYHAVTLPLTTRLPMLVVDASLVLVSALVVVAARRGVLAGPGIGRAAVGVLLAMATATLIVQELSREPFATAYLALIITRALHLIVARRVAVASVTLMVVAWAALSIRWMDPHQLARCGLVLAVACWTGVVLHNARRRTTTRILQLRRDQTMRQEALESALAEAEAARRDLDRIVEERTAELQCELAERRRVEAEHARLGDQLRQAQKMDAVGRLAGGIAHDFNNLLTVLRASLDVASQRLTHDPQADDALRDASDATDRAAALTRGLLAFGRKQTLERAPIDAADITRGLDRMLARVASAKIRVVTEASWRDATVLADRGQIEQVLLNLAINACDAMPDGGTLRVAVLDGALTQDEAKAHGVIPGAYVRILVSDTGHGMDERTKGALFEPFFTTKPVGQGTGLGLAVAHGIVTQHGGMINVASAPGAGSTFEVWLPRVVPVASQPRTPILSSRPPRRSDARETILVVEDEPGVRRATVRILESYGYRVLVAGDGASALTIAAALESIDLVVSDVVMPDLDGPAVVARLRERWPDLKALFVSGYTADHFAAGSPVRSDSLLQKPYRPKELANAVREAMYGFG